MNNKKKVKQSGIMMKTFRVTYVKEKGVSLMLPLMKNPPNVFLEQIIKCDSEKIDIPMYPGFNLIGIIELLPELIIKSDVKN